MDKIKSTDDIETIVNVVCKVCGITRNELESRSKREPIPVARALIAHFLYNELRMLPRSIARYIGSPYRNRTSVYHYLRKEGSLIDRWAPCNKDIREKAEQISGEIIRRRDQSL